MAKGDLIRAIMGMKHSPAGQQYKGQEKVLASRRRLNKLKKEVGTEDVYFKGIKRKTTEQQLRDAGLSDADLRSLRGKG